MKVLCDIQCELCHEYYPTGNKLKVHDFCDIMSLFLIFFK